MASRTPLQVVKRSGCARGRRRQAEKECPKEQFGQSGADGRGADAAQQKAAAKSSCSLRGNGSHSEGRGRRGGSDSGHSNPGSRRSRNGSGSTHSRSSSAAAAAAAAARSGAYKLDAGLAWQLVGGLMWRLAVERVGQCCSRMHAGHGLLPSFDL